MLKDSLGVECELIQGSGGIFQVQVDGQVVAEKGRTGFPSEAQLIDAVRSALGR